MIARLRHLVDDAQARRRVMRFVGVGLACTAIYYGVARAASALGASLLGAHAVGYGVSIVASYFAQKRFTFEIRGEHARAAPRFVLATALIAGVQVLLVLALGAASVSAATIFLISSAYYPVASFLAHSLWTFLPKAFAAGRGAENRRH